jgi:probable DNA metabolism protein
MRSVTLAHEADFAGFRAAARRLLLARVPPEDVSWQVAGNSGALFGTTLPDGVAEGTVNVPRAFVHIAEKAALHRDPGRFALLYRLLWRLRSERRLLALAFDPDVARARVLEQAVDREIHKMHGYVRFRRAPGVTPEILVAWFEPEHHVLAATAPFFVRRFPNFPWAILTPERSAHWDTKALRYGPGARRADAPADDAAEALWREYYASIFNPARLNVAAMRAHMPMRYWRNLPESASIPTLVATAEKRTEQMIAAPPTEPTKRRRAPAPRASRIDPKETPGTLAALRELAADCRSCALWQYATQTVFGEGSPDARVVIVGEQPGDREDIVGKPFVGPAGQLLDRALREAGVERGRTYVTNAVKHFKFLPRGKRRLHKTPGQLEVAACRQWLLRELDMIRPQLIVALGATAAHAVLGRTTAVQKARGTLLKASSSTGETLDVIVTVHPSYLLRLDERERAAAYAEFVADLRMALPYLAARAPERA